MKLLRYLVRCLTVAAAALPLVANDSARAESAAEFYEGNTIRFVVGYGPGGGYDRYARMLAPYLEEETGATVVVENRPGGGGLTALNAVSTADPDGTTIMLLNGVSAVLGQLTDAPGARYDMTEVEYLGRVAAEKWAIMTSVHSPYRTAEDMIEASNAGETITFSGIGRTDGPTDAASVFCEALRIQCRMIIGYEGSKDSALAAVRGEVNALSTSDRSAAKYTGDDGLIPVAILARERSELLPDVPTVFEAADLSPEDAFWIDYRSDITEVGRVVVTTPGVAADRLTYLSDAFRRILTDPKVIAEGKETDNRISYMEPEAVKRKVESSLVGLPDGREDAVKDVLLQKYF